MKSALAKVSALNLFPVMKICLVAAVVLAVIMAFTSDYDRHSDEHHHFAAARYYMHIFFRQKSAIPRFWIPTPFMEFRI